MNRPKLSVIMPAYNEGARIFSNIAVTVEELSSSTVDFEVIVVNDGSLDDTALEAQRAANLMEQVRVISYSTNQGKGRAVLTGAMAAAGDLVAFIDADLDIHPRQLRLAVDVQRTTGADVVIGSKWHPQSVVAFPVPRRLISYCYYVMVRILFGLPVRDTQTGLKLYKRALIRRLAERVSCPGYVFDLEMLTLAYRWGSHMQDMPVVVESCRTACRLRLKDAVAIGRDTMRLFWSLLPAEREESLASAGTPVDEGLTAKVGRS